MYNTIIKKVIFIKVVIEYIHHIIVYGGNWSDK